MAVSFGEHHNKKFSSFGYAFGVLFFFAAIVSFAAYKLGADMNWDVLNYHFYNGYAFLSGRMLSDTLGTLQSYLDPLLNSYYYILITRLSPLQENMVIATMQSISISLLYFLTNWIIATASPAINAMLRIAISLMISATAILGPIFWSEIGGTMGDTLLSSGVIGGLYLALLSLNGNNQEKTNYTLVAAAGLLLGFVSGLKFTNIIYVVGLFSAYTISSLMSTPLSYKTGMRKLVILAVTTITAIFITDLPMSVTLLNRFGNPIFPFYNNIFMSPYYIGTAFHDMRWFPETIFGYLFMPLKMWHTRKHFGLEFPFTSFFFGVVELLLPFYFAVCWYRWKNKVAVNIKIMFLTLFFVSSFVAWEIVFSYYRYIAALEILSPLLVVSILGELFKFNKYAIVIITALLLITGINETRPDWGRINYGETYFGLSKADFSGYRNSLLIAGYMPIGFVIPYFQKSNQVISIPVKGFTKLFIKDYFVKKLDMAIIEKRPVFFFSKWDSGLRTIRHNALFLERYGVYVKYNTCVKITSKIYKIGICEAYTQKSGQKP
ncbi:MAG: hypothetical protein ACYDDP_08615 [Acidithiobacillus sp.]